MAALSTCTAILRHSGASTSRQLVAQGRLGALGALRPRCIGSTSNPLAKVYGQNFKQRTDSRVLKAAADNVAAETSYQGVAFDMDGTMTVSNIDFNKMRDDTDIPYGDLFTVMEAWKDESKIKKSMDIILELEDQAEKTLEIMEGLRELLMYLKEQDIKVALVTRNTPKAVDAFFKLLGDEHASIFDVVITRHHKYVKPDYRLLRDLAAQWDIPEESMLMVGDSGEDVECGNAAGTATAWIQGGGNEVGGDTRPPPGAVPTFTITGLPDLLDKLRNGTVAPGWGVPGTPTGLASMSASMDSMDEGDDIALAAGAPPPGVDFLDFLYSSGAIRTARCSFPRMGGAAGGMMASTTMGDRVLHVGCGKGGLTKLLASQGLETVGIDVDPSAADRRGLMAIAYDGTPLSIGSLAPALGMGPSVTNAEIPSPGLGTFDAIVMFEPDAELLDALASTTGASTITSVLSLGGRFCFQSAVTLDQESALMDAMDDVGMIVDSATRVVTPSGFSLRLVAAKPGLQDM